MARATKLRVVGGKTNAYVTPRPPPHGLPVGAPCPNCGTTLAGPWCYACGQKGEEFHRSVLHLVADAFEGLTHFDGRFWSTLPRLMFAPDRLTRDYLDGHRVSQVPPFRMFLVVILVVFFAGSTNFRIHPVELQVRPGAPTEQQVRNRKDIAATFDTMRVTPAGRWLAEHGEQALSHPGALLTAMEHWSHQFAILMLPLAAFWLSLLFAFKRGVYIFDHLIFSMHSLSFQGLLLSSAFLLSLVAGDGAWSLLLLAPVHLFFHMRGAYQIGAFGTLARMAVLFAGSALSFGLLMAGLFLAGLASLH